MPGTYGMTAAEAARRAASGDARAIARVISALEDGSEWGREAAQLLQKAALGGAEDPAAAALHGRELSAAAAAAPRSRVIGVTGPPGAGKSSLVDRLIAGSRGRGRRVAVLAIDPSSPFSGGALLGDRIRMRSGWDDEGVFIRSLASRGRLGGLSLATAESARALEAAGREDIFIETAGVGQSEVDVAGVADLVVVVCVPGLGDDIQAIKAGIMEIGDVFAVNKADRGGAERTVAELRDELDDRGAPVIAVSAETGAGLPELTAAIDARYAQLLASGRIAARRAGGLGTPMAGPREEEDKHEDHGPGPRGDRGLEHR